jgi:hypothetical protein
LAIEKETMALLVKLKSLDNDVIAFRAKMLMLALFRSNEPNEVRRGKVN